MMENKSSGFFNHFQRFLNHFQSFFDLFQQLFQRILANRISINLWHFFYQIFFYFLLCATLNYKAYVDRLLDLNSWNKIYQNFLLNIIWSRKLMDTEKKAINYDQVLMNNFERIF